MLARLRLTAAEQVRFAEQLGRVVDYIDQLESFAVEEMLEAPEPQGAPATHGLFPPLPEAADVIVPCLRREAFLANAPAAADGFLLVPEIKGSGDG